jgi:hypothetical protein
MPFLLFLVRNMLFPAWVFHGITSCVTHLYGWGSTGLLIKRLEKTMFIPRYGSGKLKKGAKNHGSNMYCSVLLRFLFAIASCLVRFPPKRNRSDTEAGTKET